MGWTGMYIQPPFNAKEELDKLFTWANTEKEVSVVKSATKGSEYYAAVRIKKEGKPEEVIGVAVRFSRRRSKDGCNFFYNAVEENAGPVLKNCPVSVLNLLGITDNAEALNWRNDCYKNAAKLKDPNSLRNLPVGAKVTFHAYFDGGPYKKGDKVTLYKIVRRTTCRKRDGGSYEKITSFWTDGMYRWSEKHIPSDYLVLEGYTSAR